MPQCHDEQPVDFSKILVNGEKIIWSGRPCRPAFIYKRFLMGLPLAIIWGAIDFGFISLILVGAGLSSPMMFFMVPFFAIHLLPVWIWLGGVLSSRKRWSKTQYAVTDKRIIIQSGFLGDDYRSIHYKDIKNVHLRLGILDKMYQVGDIYFDIGALSAGASQSNNRVHNPAAFLSIRRAGEIYPQIQKAVMDIQADIHFPNELRPEVNSGYDTQYRGQ